jgi:hypothetical protein
LNQKTLKLQEDLKEQINNNTQLLAENSQRQVELKAKEEEIAALEQKEINATKWVFFFFVVLFLLSLSISNNRYKEQLSKKVKQLEERLKEVESTKEALKLEITSQEKEVEAYKKATEAERKNAENLMRERELLNKSLDKADAASQKQMDIIKISESTKKNLEQEIQGFKTQAQAQRKVKCSAVTNSVCFTSGLTLSFFFADDLRAGKTKGAVHQRDIRGHAKVPTSNGGGEAARNDHFGAAKKDCRWRSQTQAATSKKKKKKQKQACTPPLDLFFWSHMEFRTSTKLFEVTETTTARTLSNRKMKLRK